MTEPIMRDVPEQMETERLTMRPAAAINAAYDAIMRERRAFALQGAA